MACSRVPETAEGELTIARIFPGTNALASPTRFRMEPAEVIDAFRAMREEGMRLAAIFHSHPTSPPTLSPIDLAEAHYPEAAILIVSFAGDVPEAAAWRLERRGAQWAAAQIPIHVQASLRLGCVCLCARARRVGGERWVWKQGGLSG